MKRKERARAELVLTKDIVRLIAAWLDPVGVVAWAQTAAWCRRALLDDWSGWPAACGQMQELRPHPNNLITVGARGRALKRIPFIDRIDDSPRLFVCAAASTIAERRALRARAHATAVVGAVNAPGVRFCALFNGHPVHEQSDTGYVPESWPSAEYFVLDEQTGVLRHVVLHSINTKKHYTPVAAQAQEQDVAACDILVLFPCFFSIPIVEKCSRVLLCNMDSADLTTRVIHTTCEGGPLWIQTEDATAIAVLARAAELAAPVQIPPEKEKCVLQ